MTKYVTRKCPTCGSADSIKAIHTDPCAEVLPFEKIQSSWNGLFNQKIIFSYGRCKDCGLLFCPKYLSEPQLAELYGSMPINMTESNGDSNQKTQIGYVSHIKNKVNFGDDYLEIGPDIGLFAKHASNRWQFNKIWMYEPNKKVSIDIIKSLDGKNFEIVHELNDLSKVQDSTVGLAVLVHVLDHLTEPADMLMQIKRKMKPGAQLLIVTHNERTVLAKALGVRWPAYCMQHPQIYNKSSMRKLVESAGLRLESIEDSKNYMQISFLIRTLFWVLFNKKIRVPRVLDIDIGLRLGNIITIVSK